ncbi:MAG: acyltransferase [Acidobacteriota bacterium]
MKKNKASVQKELISQESAFKKYGELFVGKTGLWSFIKYELIVLLFSWIPGALGVFARKCFYPLLLKKVGKGVAFGHHITLRHPHKISISDHSFIDDYSVLDAKGDDNEGIRIGKNTYIGRNTILSCKGGSIFLGDYSNISANCSLLSETLIEIGAYTFLAGHCYLVAGGNHRFDRTDIPIMRQPSLDKGGIRISPDCWLGASVVVLDGVSLGRGCVVGAGAVVNKSLPEYSIAVGVPAKKIGQRT